MGDDFRHSTRTLRRNSMRTTPSRKHATEKVCCMSGMLSIIKKLQPRSFSELPISCLNFGCLLWTMMLTAVLAFLLVCQRAISDTVTHPVTGVELEICPDYCKRWSDG